MSEWISVEDRLPETGIMVLALYRWPHQSRTRYGLRQLDEDGCWYNETGAVMWNIHTDNEPVTHWMPLPEPPEDR